MYALHIAPFDPTGYPPLIHTVHVSASWGIESVVIASSPQANDSMPAEVEVLAPRNHLSGFEMQRFFFAQARHLLRRRGRPTLAIGHNALGLPAAALVGSMPKVPFVYHCHDFHGGGPFGKPIATLADSILAPRAAEVWVPAPERAQEAARRGVGTRLRVVRNCPRRIQNLPLKGRLRAWLSARNARSRGEGKIITRHGGIGTDHCIMEIVEALPLLPENTDFVVIGRDNDGYAVKCQARARALGVQDRVFFHPFVSHAELLELIVDGDVASGLYLPTDVNTAAPAPNKVYENLALGVPVVVLAGTSLASDINESGGGVALGSLDPPSLAEALRQLLFDWAFGQRAARAARTAHLTAFNYEAQLSKTILFRRNTHSEAAPTQFLSER